MRYVLHMTGMSRWREADGDVVPDSLRTEGFAHASPDSATMVAVANAFYRDATEQQVVLVVDTGRLDAEVRWEPAVPGPPPGVVGDVLFPHVYGPIRREAVIGVRYLRRDPAGAYTAVERRGDTAESLDLLPHPEGGWYRSTWRTGISVHPPGYPGQRATASGIHFLLCPGEHSRWHRVRSDEVWVFNRGGPLRLALGGTGERPVGESERTLGPYIDAGQDLQVVVPAGTWQTAHPLTSAESVVSCFVSPGFEFADFEVEPG
ncbi:hypothetical protein F4561_002874 [Lipingzhangella halophila]|uniref:DUF985 domain-containing protein n=1 Tax=Lipingzhangella halophila TaxID=1783352 RepID=A0A7W7W3Q5_9ACTN|nr:cupin domain-containing protein [Lipingzhangella halophila]MBB4932054.1 hypothetical protein [Lipingzhangella halophila]